MNEQDLAKKITRTLNWGLTQIDDSKLAKLRVAREKAMAGFQEPVVVATLATSTGHAIEMPGMIRKPLFWLPILAVVTALVIYQTSGDDDIYDESGELDAQLLTGELPINAFLDKEFGSWVKESAR